MSKQKLPPRWLAVIGLFTCIFTLVACGPKRYEAAPDGQGRAVVIWISLDGVRPDYIGRSHTPTIERLINEGAYSLALAPIFPSLTFPNHVSQSTGVSVDKHGIPLNSFYDIGRDRKYRYPGLPFLLEAEPIWTTVKRQGPRVAVYDWVLSHRQEEPNAADYFNDRYSNDTTDEERIQQILDTWQNDQAHAPLQLIMGYQVTPDKMGHEYGPGAPEIAESMELMDRHFEWLIAEAVNIFNRRMRKGDELYLIITSDHGMSEVHTVVHPLLLTGVSREEDREEQIIVMTTGTIGHVFLHKIEDETERAEREAEIIRLVSEHDFVRIYRRDKLPPHWHYNHLTRVGDLVLSLETGYGFSRRSDELTGTPAETGTPLGMHGYDVADNPEMNGIAIFWRYPEPIGGIDLGPTHSLQLHATVAHLLGVEPAEGADTDIIEWD